MIIKAIFEKLHFIQTKKTIFPSAFHSHKKNFPFHSNKSIPKLKRPIHSESNFIYFQVSQIIKRNEISWNNENSCKDLLGCVNLRIIVIASHHSDYTKILPKWFYEIPVAQFYRVKKNLFWNFLSFRTLCHL